MSRSGSCRYILLDSSTTAASAQVSTKNEVAVARGAAIGCSWTLLPPTRRCWTTDAATDVFSVRIDVTAAVAAAVAIDVVLAIVVVVVFSA